MVIWLTQYLAGEGFWYLTEIGTDGIETEMFFMKEEELNQYISDNNLSSEYDTNKI